MMNNQKTVAEYKNLILEINQFTARLNDHNRYFADLVHNDELHIDDSLGYEMVDVIIKLKTALRTSKDLTLSSTNVEKDELYATE